jgi:hypothetical protein
MPAHTVCVACGFRTPVEAALPQGTRTWDSSRDEERYEREKRRRQAVDVKKQAAASQMAVPASRMVRAKRAPHDNVIDIGRRQAR